MHNPGSIPLSAFLWGAPAQVINNNERKMRPSLVSQNFICSLEGFTFSAEKIILTMRSLRGAISKYNKAN